jgi:hypothetical protein
MRPHRPSVLCGLVAGKEGRVRIMDYRTTIINGVQQLFAAGGYTDTIYFNLPQEEVYLFNECDALAKCSVPLKLLN